MHVFFIIDNTWDCYYHFPENNKNHLGYEVFRLQNIIVRTVYEVI